MALELPTPTSFPAFPYDPPYSIQVDLMRHLYASIEQGAVTIVESPTGTGKTLSLLCATLTWLADEKNRARKGKMKAVVEDESGTCAKDWVIEQTVKRARRELEADELDYVQRLAEAQKREQLMKRMANARVVKKPRRETEKPSYDKTEEEDDGRFLPDDYESQASKDGEMNISPALRALMDKVDKGPRQSYNDRQEEITCTKIYYASRTHSQLAQVLPEMSKLKLPQVVSMSSQNDTDAQRCNPKRALDEDDFEGPLVSTRTVALGSRNQLCINDEVRAKARNLDESCRELLGENAGKRCQFLPPLREDSQMLDFRDQILASPKDIEDLASSGRMSNICPYFGSRRAINQAELVTLPYNLLLQKTAREALGINLKDQIVVIDEAHNLIPTLLSLSTTCLLYSTLCTSFQQVCNYVSKFRTRLSAVNMLHLKRLVIFLDALKKYVSNWKEGRATKGSKMETTEIMTVAELIQRLGNKVAGINLLEIEVYLKKSKVARKIADYSDKQVVEENDLNTQRRIRRGIIPPLHSVEAFLLSLTNANEDGRVSLTMNGAYGREDIELKYQLLNPSCNFKEVVDEARAVILAGGTMSPISDVINQLFAHLPVERITNFSCGHIIPENNMQTLVVCKGPRGGDLEFKADKQNDASVLDELGQILLNYTSVVPAGLVVFFPSYKFLNAAKKAWSENAMIGKLSAKKRVFFEPEETTDVERVLQEYATTIKIHGGAMMLAVVGAKLSEGLNFTDDLARAVAIVGLPFANLGSPELRERMKYVKHLEQLQGGSKDKGRKDAAAELYENMCMNAVNQSIGRAIRHKGDWASLILLDRRYGNNSIRKKLPKWIGGRLVITEGFGQTIKEMGAFFRSKRV